MRKGGGKSARISENAAEACFSRVAGVAGGRGSHGIVIVEWPVIVMVMVIVIVRRL